MLEPLPPAGPGLVKPLVLVLTSLGAEAGGYLERAAALAQAQGARLRLAYCPDPGARLGHPLPRLKQRARYLGRLLGRPVETLDVELQTPEALRQRLDDCTLVCMAKPARGRRSGQQRWLRCLLDWRLRPLLLVGPGGQRPYAKLLLPLSLGPGSPGLLHWAETLAPQAALELLHVTQWPEQAAGRRPSAAPSVLDEMLHQAWSSLRRRLRSVSATLDEDPTRLRCSLAQGSVCGAIHKLQMRHGHDLVVVGIRARKPWLSWLWPDLASRLARCLDCDLLVIPQNAAHEGLPTVPSLALRS